MLSSPVIFDFNKESNLSNWVIVDDVVMGGRSNGGIKLSPEGHGIFEGTVSLDNNGGFSSLRYRFKAQRISEYNTIVLHLKGDGKVYQFRTKTNAFDRQSYVAEFTTNGEWQKIEIPMSSMYPTFRGVRLNMQNYPGQQMEEIAFLIGNKKAESFRLEIDKIELKMIKKS